MIFNTLYKFHSWSSVWTVCGLLIVFETASYDTRTHLMHMTTAHITPAQKFMMAVTPLIGGQRSVAFWKALEQLYRLGVQSARLNDFCSPARHMLKGVLFPCDLWLWLEPKRTFTFTNYAKVTSHRERISEKSFTNKWYWPWYYLSISENRTPVRANLWQVITNHVSRASSWRYLDVSSRHHFRRTWSWCAMQDDL